ncbi:MAG: oligopeptide/dipeptide ABC transporter ATP-binding protein, partial [Desulfitobacterium hafniense]
RFGFADPKRIMAAYPFELSGGMQQRVLCALGISCTPRWVLADEPTKGLDLALREQVYENLLKVKEQGVEGMLIITHDLVLAETLCDGVAVMYSGEIVEWGQNSLREPLHPYTQAFLESLPGKGMKPLPGAPPAPWDHPPGCKFAPRCAQCTARCTTERPGVYVREGKMVRCFLYA